VLQQQTHLSRPIAPCVGIRHLACLGSKVLQLEKATISAANKASRCDLRNWFRNIVFAVELWTEASGIHSFWSSGGGLGNAAVPIGEQRCCIRAL
jgi:hypothetical protein